MNIETNFSQESGHSSTPAEFFQNICQVYAKAEQAWGETIDRFYMLGGFSVRLCFAGPALTPLFTPALSHLQTVPTPNPDLTIFIWDSKSTGTKMPEPPWTADDYLQFGLIDGFNTKRIKTLVRHALFMADLEQNKAIYWIFDAKNIPYYDSITPLRTIINWWMNRREQFIIHAAAVGLPEGGVIITGKGGAGKSTTALSCIGSGIKYAGDENCLISLKPTPYVHSIYCSGTLESDDVDKIPSIRPYLINPSRINMEKAVYMLYDDKKSDLIKGFPIKAVFVPQVTGEKETIIRKRASGKTLIALGPGSIFQLPGAGRESLRAMAELLKQVPCYTLELGTDLHKIPIKIEEFIRSQP